MATPIPNLCLLSVEAKLMRGDVPHLKKMLTLIITEKARVNGVLGDGVTKENLPFWEKYNESLDAASATLNQIWDYFSTR